MTERLVIEGGRPLQGVYRVQGNKNAALPLVAAALLSRKPVTLRNVPRIVDIENLVRLLGALDVKTDWEGNRLSIDAGRLREAELSPDIVHRLRGAILLLGVLAPRMDTLACALPGGCPIGQRSFQVHWSVFRAAGFRIEQDPEKVVIRRERQVRNPRVFLEEASVTATENALILFAGLGGGTIANPAREPHVACLIEFLRKLGCSIEVDALSIRVGAGLNAQPAPEFTVPGDYVDAGTLAIAAAVTGGDVAIDGITADALLGIRPVLDRFGVHMTASRDSLWAVSVSPRSSPPKITAGPWPAFPTDLVSLAIVLATQSEGHCLIHDWMYEARMFFVDKLARMGASVTLCDPHRVLVAGPRRLRGIHLESPDIRAGMALVVAGLCADGTTDIEHAEVIRRGYERVDQRLAELGASVFSEPQWPGRED